MKDKFLTVYAVFDESTQQKLKSIQNRLQDMGYIGKQLTDIPFHITLGSFPLEYKEVLSEKISSVCSSTPKFSINLKGINHFSDKVLFIEPEVNEQLAELHNLFDCNYADGFPWRAHVTLYIDSSKKVKKVKKYLSQSFVHIQAQAVGIEMGEFFPAQKIISKDFV